MDSNFLSAAAAAAGGPLRRSINSPLNRGGTATAAAVPVILPHARSCVQFSWHRQFGALAPHARCASDRQVSISLPQ
jgi:hypothetical protein